MNHRVRWFGIVPGTGERIPRNGSMNGRDWGWDVECSCGWHTRTGGAIQERIRDEIHCHRREAQLNDGTGGAK